MSFILKFFNKPVMSYHVTISSANKPCKQNEIIITFASNQPYFIKPVPELWICHPEAIVLLGSHIFFKLINYDFDLATALRKIKTSNFSLPQPPLPPVVLTENVTDVWGPFIVHWICESIQGCHLFRLVLVI